jgi:phosphoribosylformylglycinamidine synthase subunit PurL
MTTTPTPTQPYSEALQHQLKALNVRPSEYAKILKHLGREPNFTELVMFSALWSEHCSYKHSKHLLKTLPVEGPQIAQGPGENAGIVDCGDGILVAFKVESHNHPTYVEPFQGAATGVGGILRDIFTMNARPIALLNALRFGPTRPMEGVEDSQGKANQYRFSQAIAGSAHYGNCMGIATVGGDVGFDPDYSHNPLVNVMALGLMEPNGVMFSGAVGVGNPVVYVGSPTGKDGMGGASFASRSLDTEGAKADRPAVQVGDPFLEKQVMEACLEAFKTGAVLSSQDMGAAGLTCATAEMAAKGGLGMRVDLDLVPVREPGLEPWEYMASESQERMLMVLEKGREEEALAVFRKWQVPAVVIGEVLQEPRLHVIHQGQRVVDLPVMLLTEMAPQYVETITEEPAQAKSRRERSPKEGLPEQGAAAEWPEVLKQLLGHPNVCSRAWVYRQFDRHVRHNTLLDSDNNGAGLLRLRKPDGTPSEKALAVTLDGNPYPVALNPYRGGQGIVAEAARNLVAVGAKPLAVTNNLNFGNPEDPAVYHQLYYTVLGMKEACEALKTPVTGGNVSLYNQNERGSILPSPTLGMIGLLEDYRQGMTPHWKSAGDRIALLGRFLPTLAGSAYQRLLSNGAYWGEAPSLSLQDEALLNTLVLELIEAGLLASVQDVSTGGLLTTLAECSLQPLQINPKASLFGFDLEAASIQQAFPSLDEATLWFGETQGCYVLSYRPEQEALIRQRVEKAFAQTLSKLQYLSLGSVLETPEIRRSASSSVSCDLTSLSLGWLEGLL